MKRVLITRAAHQSLGLAEALRTAGMEPVVVPAIEIAPPESYCAVDAALACLASYDWVVLTSANAVDGLWARMAALHVSGLPAAMKVAAIGKATARALEERGVRVDVVPERAVAESLVEALGSQVSGKRMLLPRAEAGREILPERLVEAGAEVTVVAVYRNVVPEGSVAAVRELFASREAWPDAVAFTSGSSVTHLLALAEAAGVKLPEAMLRVSIGPVTSGVLRGVGLPPHAEALEASIGALVEAIEEAGNRK